MPLGRKGTAERSRVHRAAYATPHGSERRISLGCGATLTRARKFRFAGVGSSPCRVISRRFSDFRVADLVGNGWEWTRTPFSPFPGFNHFLLSWYSANFSTHNIRDERRSPRTAACMLRRSFRNWFQPHYPYIYAAFRCVER